MEKLINQNTNHQEHCMSEIESILRTVAGQPDVFGTAACAELLTYAAQASTPPDPVTE